jgi:UDP-2,4-diacetamido-2,4,6-trideoxy-beta-L-altropyranose hydrolase
MKFLVRAESNSHLGTGHILRTLTLARQLVKKGHEIFFISHKLYPELQHRLRTSGCQLLQLSEGDNANELEEISHYFNKLLANWIIVDHYEATEQTYRIFKDYGLKILAIDDINATTFPVDILVNQNINASSLNYRCPAHTIRLLGPQYAIIDPLYREKREYASVRSRIESLLIFMGGTDPDNQTEKALNAAITAKQFKKIAIVIGPGYTKGRELRKTVAQTSVSCDIYKDLPDLADVLLESDLAIGAGGSTTWEMCCLFLPMILIPIAANQYPIARGLADYGAAKYPGNSQELSCEQLTTVLRELTITDCRKMSERAGTLCDGNGVAKIVEKIDEISRQ